MLDLSGVTAFDAAALHVVVEAAEWAREEGGSPVVRNPSDAVRRTLGTENRLDLLEGGADGA